MENLQVVVLALIQGLTEFLPISSSAHLILVPQLAGWPDQGLAFDVATHVGTLIAVVTYFRHELDTMTRACIASVTGGARSPDAYLAWAVVFGTIPAAIAGWFLHDVVESDLRSPLVIATTTIVFGVLLWWADAKGRRRRDEHTISWNDVMVIGLAQALALVPGVSRSGITMTAGLFVGLTRAAAARFSFLLSIPIIVLAGGFETMRLINADEVINWAQMGLGVVLSAVSAFLCIHFFLRLLDRIGFMPFVLYRFALGAVLFVVFR